MLATLIFCRPLVRLGGGLGSAHTDSCERGTPLLHGMAWGHGSGVASNKAVERFQRNSQRHFAYHVLVIWYDASHQGADHVHGQQTTVRHTFSTLLDALNQCSQKPFWSTYKNVSTLNVYKRRARLALAHRIIDVQKVIFGKWYCWMERRFLAPVCSTCLSSADIARQPVTRGIWFNLGETKHSLLKSCSALLYFFFFLKRYPIDF